MKFSEKLKKLRIEKGITQKELAEKLFVSRSSVAKWEQGRGYPGLETLEKLAGIFDVTIDDLLTAKEYKSMTISCAKRTKINEQANLVIMILGCVVIISIIFLFCLFFSLKNQKEELYYYQLYATVNVEENALRLEEIDWENDIVNTKKIVCIQEDAFKSIIVYDKYGAGQNVSDLRSGEQVLVSYTTKKKNRLQDMQIYKIDVIDDYLEGDYYSYGFFIATEAVNYDKPPIWEGDDSVNEWKGEASSLSYRYPYRKEYYNGHSYGPSGDLICLKERSGVAYAANDESYAIAKKAKYSIKISNRIQTLYIYALDNSERGYTLVEEVKSDSSKISITTGALFNEKEKKNNERAYKIDMTFEIEVDFSSAIESTVIKEYDKNHACTFEKKYETADNLEGDNVSYLYMTLDDTRYVNVYVNYYTKDGNTLLTLLYSRKTRGEVIQIPVETYYGYVIQETVTLY